jgi:hypothetical protein
VHTEREFIDVGALASEVEDADLGIGYTTVESRLRVGLQRSQYTVQMYLSEAESFRNDCCNDHCAEDDVLRIQHTLFLQ